MSTSLSSNFENLATHSQAWETRGKSAEQWGREEGGWWRGDVMGGKSCISTKLTYHSHCYIIRLVEP
jgi:hypothetical protein